MIGILEFCQSRGLTHLSMLAELRLAERIAAYGWPLRYLGAPRQYEGGKGVAVAAKFEVGHHVLALTRAKTGVTGAVLVEIDPEAAAQSAPAIASPEIAALVAEIGTEKLARLVRALSRDLAGSTAAERPRAIELVGAFNRLLETAGVSLEETPHNIPAAELPQP